MNKCLCVICMVLLISCTAQDSVDGAINSPQPDKGQSAKSYIIPEAKVAIYRERLKKTADQASSEKNTDKKNAAKRKAQNKENKNRKTRKRAVADYSQYKSPQGDDCVQHEDYFRCWYIHVPDNLTAKVPLLLDLHGFTSSAAGQRSISGFAHLADRDKFIVVWPDGLHHSWNAGSSCCGQSVADNIDDVGFLRKLIDRVSNQQSIDQSRIYITGISNGSAMSQRFVSEASDIVAASASLALYLLVPPGEDYTPVPLMEIRGSLDRVVNWDGSDYFPSAMENLEAWRTMNGCKGEAEESWREGSHYALTYNRCSNGAEITLVRIDQGGHVIYPQFGANIDTPQMAWDFMKRFSK